MTNKPITINLHFTNKCNMKCKGCYAHLNNSTNLNSASWISIISNISNELSTTTRKKINFVGGEPTIISFLPNLVKKAKSLGFTTSIVTNGSMITAEYLSQFNGTIDWIGVSVDSTNATTLKDIGRVTSNGNVIDYLEVCKTIINAGIKLKINTVASRKNRDEDFFNFFLNLNVKRWKVFQFLSIKGENDCYTDEFRISKVEFEDFKSINSHTKSLTHTIFENCDDMIESYIMVDPQGRPFSNKNNKITYGTSLLHSSLLLQAKKLGFKYDKFENRGGIYEWERTNLAITI